MKRHIVIQIVLLSCSSLLPALETQAQSTIGDPRLLQGPMVGAVSENQAQIWVRLSGPFSGQLLYADNSDLNNAQTSEEQQAQKAQDYTLTLRAQNLEPNTTYYYKILVNGGPGNVQGGWPAFSFRTAPPEPSQFTVAFGSCSRYQQDPTQVIWETVDQIDPDLFFWLGDNIYADTRDADIIAEEYRRQFQVRRLVPLLRSIPQLAVWDDHDFGLNNHDRTNPIKEDALRVFQQYWANPSYGLPSTPGCFFRYHYGGVDFFFLDVRYYRDPNQAPDNEEKTMLGEAQLEWLKNGLAESGAAFKVLVSGSGWTQAKGYGGDSWASFTTERNRLFGYITENNITGVVLLSGDTHIAELNAIPWSENGGYDFYDLVSSPLAQEPGGFPINRHPERRIRQGYNQGPNAGFIHFDMTAQPPTLRFNVYNTEHTPVWPWFELTASELQNGQSTWREKMDGVSKRRYDNQQAGKGYYFD